jgi:hypothetical protein
MATTSRGASEKNQMFFATSGRTESKWFFTKEEDDALLNQYQRHDKNWGKILEHPSLTGCSCYHIQRRLSYLIQTSEKKIQYAGKYVRNKHLFSKEDKQLLLEQQKIHNNNAKAIVKHPVLSKFTVPQIQSKMYSIKRRIEGTSYGRDWTKEEEEALKNQHAIHGSKWLKCSEHSLLSDRSRHQVENKWNNMKKYGPNTKSSGPGRTRQWTLEQEEVLRSQRTIPGSDWGTIERHPALSGLTREKLQSKWNRMQRKNPDCDYIPTHTWTHEEVRALQRQVVMYGTTGTCWDEIAQHPTLRRHTSGSIRIKWFRLKSKDSKTITTSSNIIRSPLQISASTNIKSGCRIQNGAPIDGSARAQGTGGPSRAPTQANKSKRGGVACEDELLSPVESLRKRGHTCQSSNPSAPSEVRPHEQHGNPTEAQYLACPVHDNSAPPLSTQSCNETEDELWEINGNRAFI